VASDGKKVKYPKRRKNGAKDEMRKLAKSLVALHSKKNLT
jgi:hypothetical protein